MSIPGADVSPRFAVAVVAALSPALIALFAVMALFAGALDLGTLSDIESDPGDITFVSVGWWQVVLAMPFVTWLHLGIDELPPAAEEWHVPACDVPVPGRRGSAP